MAAEGMKEVELQSGGDQPEATEIKPTGEGGEEDELEECEEMPDDPDMDPLEYTVRKVLPIPKKYFWESNRDPDNLSFRTKLWHRSVAVLGKMLYVAEYAGEVIAHVFGLNESRYQYVMDNMTKEDWEKAHKVNEEREAEWEQFRAQQEVEKETGIKSNAL
eukprot:CAMPEP_0182490566 /NCGR_PEP_ID=MMETSP1321-20130603/383_1 /TAXON_ID=91990 /ORGANISM="Bolidomonas sp., Strain RCC1657" /LENGTH=160 /DNA_ID=CAMNT_0024692773 /DNA_START=96 /DNA_END=578 /DNA_ORIENTATION=-